MKRTTALTAASSLAAMTLFAGVAMAPANAETLVAQDTTTPAATAPRTQLVGIDYTPGGLTVTGHQGKKVTVSAPESKTRSMTPDSMTAPVTFTKLTPGKTYAVSIGGAKVATAQVMGAPGKTTGMKVHLRDGDPGSVLMTWDYTPVKGSGQVEFRLTATPIVGQADHTPVSLDVPGSEREAVLSGLNPHTLYKFSVSAINPAAAGKASSAAMTRTLGDLTGADDAAARKAADDARAKADSDAARRIADAAVPAPGSAGPGGGGPSSPTYRTVYFCTDGTLNGSSCELTRPYTFHTETQTMAYTYTWTQTGTRRNTDNQTCGYLPDANGNPVVECWGGFDEPVYSNVKNATPAGYTDNGSAWVRDVQVKDTTPVGWSDSGSAWTRTVPASSRQEVA